MKRKIQNEKLVSKSNDVKKLIKGVVNDKIKVPDSALIFLNHEDLLEVFTKKRLELVKLIKKIRPNSLNELADLTGRKKQAINRDLKILERHEVLTLYRNGRKVIPQINKKIILFPLSIDNSMDRIEKALETNIQSDKREEPLLVEVYVDGENINQKMMVGGW